MKLILQAIKSLLNRLEKLIYSTAAGLQDNIDQLDSEKIGTQDPVMYGALRLNPKDGATIGEYSTALGYNCTASGDYSHAEGSGTEASSKYSHAEGFNTEASDEGSHAEGTSTTASGYASHAEGAGTIASGDCSHAEGVNVFASGMYSHAEGGGARAIGKYSHAEGLSSIASSDYQHVQGKNNIEDSAGTYAHIVGNGTSSSTSNRSNAHTLDWDGNAWFAGTVEGTALILKSNTEGSTKRFKITVGDSGTLTATEVT